MNSDRVRTAGSSFRWRPLLAFLAVAAFAAALFHASTRQPRDVEARPAGPPSVPRLQLEVRQGQFRLQGATDPYTGWMTDHFEDGTVRLMSSVADGRLHGVSEGWFASGKPELREHFRQGLPHGIRTTWHANGQKRSEGRLLEGQQDGDYRRWHENGNLAVEAEFKDGKPHGLSRAWYPSGFLKVEALMDLGEIRTRQFHADGVRREPTPSAGIPAFATPTRTIR